MEYNKMAGKKIVKRIKESLSLGSQSQSPHLDTSRGTEGPAASTSIGDTSLAKFLEKELNEDYHKLVATSFAEFIKGDTGERNIDFDEHLHFLGYKTKQKAVELLQKKFPNIRPSEMDVEGENNFTRSGKNKKGRKRTTFFVTFDEFEELLLNAQTTEGDMARKAVLAIKNAVFKFIKIEKSRDLQQLEEQMSKLAIEETKRAELEALQVKLQATIESQRKREEKKEARKKQQKEPMETAYIMTNMPDDNQGPYKCGKTGGDPKKRAKEMQTGNHEEMRVVASVKCVDSKLVEDVMHRIFRDYRTNDKLEWFDSNLKSMDCVLNFVVRVIDGLNCVDHDEVCVDEALREAVEVLEAKIFRTSALPETPIEAVQVATEPETVDFAGQFTSDETHPFAYFAEIAIDLDGRDDDFFTTKEALKVWKALKKHRSHGAVLSKVPRESELLAYLRQHMPSEYFATAVVNYGGEPQLISGLFKGCPLRFSMLDASLTERVPEAYPSRIQDPIRTWLAENFQSTGEDKDRIGAREAWLMFKVDTKLDITENDFSSGMKNCGISETRLKF